MNISLRQQLNRFTGAKFVWLSALLSVLFLVGFNLWGRQFGVTTDHILAFELARTPEQIGQLFNDRSQEFKQWFTYMLIVDFFFIEVYTVCLIALLFASFGIRFDQITPIHKLILLLPVVAGISDVIENVMGLIILDKYPTIEPVYPLLGSTAALIKFALLGLSLVLALGFWLRRKTLA